MKKVLAVGTEVICKGGMNKGKLGEVFLTSQKTVRCGPSLQMALHAFIVLHRIIWRRSNYGWL